MEQPTFSTLRVDHLGIVAGVCKQIDLIQQIDARLPASGRTVSHGEAVQAMVLNAMGFVSRALYLTPEFFQNKPVDLLIREGIKPEELNDDCLGRTLDALFDYGVTELFAPLAAYALTCFDIPTDCVHLDSSSFSFQGDYPQKLEDEKMEEESKETPETPESTPTPIHITYGFSKDKRPDLKQAMLNLICAHNSTIPLWMEALDGNASDKKTFPKTVDVFCKQLQGDAVPLFVMDSAFYTKENVENAEGKRWVTRVPETLKAVQTLYTEETTERDWLAVPDSDLRYREVTQTYGDVAQRWIVVDSPQRARRQQVGLEKRLKKEKGRAEKALKKLSTQRFRCEMDAQKAGERLSKSWPHHTLEGQYERHEGYTKRGRPKAGQVPDRVEWSTHGTIVVNASAVLKSQQGQGLFVIGTNECDSEAWSAPALLALYKSQGVSVERGFRFLKDPLFFADGVYLQKPSRIMALMMVMTLSLLVYSLAEQSLRTELASAGETVPDQKGKPTSRPTLRRVFQLFEGLDLLEVKTGDKIQRQMLNLKDIHLKILGFLPVEVKRIYLPEEGCGR